MIPGVNRPAEMRFEDSPYREHIAANHDRALAIHVPI